MVADVEDLVGSDEVLQAIRRRFGIARPIRKRYEARVAFWVVTERIFDSACR